MKKEIDISIMLANQIRVLKKIEDLEVKNEVVKLLDMAFNFGVNTERKKLNKLKS